MLLISIDTSTRGCSVALHQNQQLLGTYELTTERSSSAMLTTLIQNVVKDAGFELMDLEAIAVAKGPGSYTGLRVGVSTAKGLCYALDKPLIAINTLEGMFEQVRNYYPAGTLFCPMIDARRMEVYAAIYNSEGDTILPTSAVIIDEESFRTQLDMGTVIFFGDGAPKCESFLGKHPNARFIQEEIRPSAKTIGRIAAQAVLESKFEDLASFEPYYLKDFMSPPPKKSKILPV
jgi:tRNA threonylcarbamoyladenosine biosynthesis protein TsaB